MPPEYHVSRSVRVVLSAITGAVYEASSRGETYTLELLRLADGDYDLAGGSHDGLFCCSYALLEMKMLVAIWAPIIRRGVLE